MKRVCRHQLAAILFAVAGWSATAQADTSFFFGMGKPEHATAQQQVQQFPCSSCHGRDARGGSEGDVPAIDWKILSKASSDRPAYDGASFFRAVTAGQSASGRVLSNLMPRYDLSEEETHALIEEISAIDARERRGVFADSVVFGVSKNVVDVVGEEFMVALERSLENSIGGGSVFGRSVQFRQVNVEEMQSDENIFAMVLPHSNLVESLIAKAIPTLAPVGQIEGDETHTLIRAITPSRRQVLEAIARELSASDAREYVVFADRPEDARELEDLMQLVGDIPAYGIGSPVSDAVLLGTAKLPFGMQPDRIWVEWHSLALRPLPPEPETIVVIDNPSLIQGAERQIHPAMVLAETAGTLLGEALKIVGRDLTRTRLIASIDDVITGTELDYKKDPLTGTSSVIFHRLSR